jgi:hypothetical protein
MLAAIIGACARVAWLAQVCAVGGCDSPRGCSLLTCAACPCSPSLPAGVGGLALPLVIVPIRRAMGLPTYQWDADPEEHPVSAPTGDAAANGWGAATAARVAAAYCVWVEHVPRALCAAPAAEPATAAGASGHPIILDASPTPFTCPPHPRLLLRRSSCTALRAATGGTSSTTPSCWPSGRSTTSTSECHPRAGTFGSSTAPSSWRAHAHPSDPPLTAHRPAASPTSWRPRRTTSATSPRRASGSRRGRGSRTRWCAAHCGRTRTTECTDGTNAVRTREARAAVDFVSCSACAEGCLTRYEQHARWSCVWVEGVASRCAAAC